jgi:hypothetical protein
MNELRINNYEDLIQFIERTDVGFEDAETVVHSCLNVISLTFDTKKSLIESTKEYIKTHGYSNKEKPIFLLPIEIINTFGSNGTRKNE